MVDQLGNHLNVVEETAGAELESSISIALMRTTRLEGGRSKSDALQYLNRGATKNLSSGSPRIVLLGLFPWFLLL